MKKILATVAVIAAATVSASAADLPVRSYTKAPIAPQAVYNWAGFYVGVGVGIAGLDTRGDLTGISEFLGPVAAPYQRSSTNAFGEVFVGYNWLFAQNWLFGVEALGKFGGNNSTTTKFNLAANGGGGGVPAGGFVSTKMNSATFIPSVRVGMLVTPATLVYGRFGWAFTTAENQIIDNGVNQFTDQGAGVSASNRKTINGPQLGIGAEFMVAGNWRAGVEVDYIWYNRTNVVGIDPNNPAQSVLNFSVRPSELSGQLRLIYGF